MDCTCHNFTYMEDINGNPGSMPKIKKNKLGYPGKVMVSTIIYYYSISLLNYILENTHILNDLNFLSVTGRSRRVAKFLSESYTFHIKSKAFKMFSCKNFATFRVPPLLVTSVSMLFSLQHNFEIYDMSYDMKGIIYWSASKLTPFIRL